MALFGSLATLRAQVPRTAAFLRAFAYAEEVLRGDSPARQRLGALAAGASHRVDLGEGVFALEQVYPTRPRAQGFFESHRKYIDLQVIVEGEELMEVVDAQRIAPQGDFNAERDLQLYSDAAGASRLCLWAGEAAVFFPADVHMPTLMAGGSPVLVRKTVVKVPVA